MNGLSVGVPGRLNANLTPCRCAQASSARAVNSGPWSTWITRGRPRQATPRRDPLEDRHDPFPGQRASVLKRGTLTTPVLHYREDAKALPVGEAVGQETHTPLRTWGPGPEAVAAVRHWRVSCAPAHGPQVLQAARVGRRVSRCSASLPDARRSRTCRRRYPYRTRTAANSRKRSRSGIWSLARLRERAGAGARTSHPDHPTRMPLAHPKADPQEAHTGALLGRLYRFFRTTSCRPCRMCLSRVRSATSCCSCRFSSSSWRNRRNSATPYLPIPANCFFQR